jgi:hypothetical protein
VDLGGGGGGSLMFWGVGWGVGWGVMGVPMRRAQIAKGARRSLSSTMTNAMRGPSPHTPLPALPTHPHPPTPTPKKSTVKTHRRHELEALELVALAGGHQLRHDPGGGVGVGAPGLEGAWDES